MTAPLLAVWLMSAGAVVAQAGAKAMFYTNRFPVAASDGQQGSDIGPRPLVAFSEFNPQGPVGIHYWFEDARGTRVTERQAAAAGGHFTPHVRGSVGAFLTVWLQDREGGRQLTPMTGPYPGVTIQVAPYAVPGDVEVGDDAPGRRIILIYSRSQTEQSSTVAHAGVRFTVITASGDADGPYVLREDEDEVSGELGTYVVNRRGGPVAAAISLRRP